TIHRSTIRTSRILGQEGLDLSVTTVQPSTSTRVACRPMALSLTAWRSTRRNVDTRLSNRNSNRLLAKVAVAATATPAKTTTATIVSTATSQTPWMIYNCLTTTGRMRKLRVKTKTYSSTMLAAT
ncbi:hypothetical protein BGZ97_011218, partial [Linnemannia gamsii]